MRALHGHGRPGREREIVYVVHRVRLSPAVVLDLMRGASLTEIYDAALRTVKDETLECGIEIQVHDIPGCIRQAEA